MARDSDFDRAVLERFNVRMVKEPKGMQMVDNETFVFSLSDGQGTAALAYCRNSQPDLYVGRSTDFALERRIGIQGETRHHYHE